MGGISGDSGGSSETNGGRIRWRISMAVVEDLS